MAQISVKLPIRYSLFHCMNELPLFPKFLYVSWNIMQLCVILIIQFSHIMASTVFFHSLRTRLTRILCNFQARPTEQKPLELPYDLHFGGCFLLETSSRQQRTHDCKQIQSAYDIKKDLDFFVVFFTPSDRALNTDRALFKSL